MRLQRVTIVLTVINLALLVAQLTRMSPLAAQETAPILRGKALQIVDDAGRVRASLGVLSPSSSNAGAKSPETVLLRLITEQGRPSVKIAASEESSGVSIAGPTGTSSTWVTVTADSSESAIVVKSENGRQQLIKP